MSKSKPEDIALWESFQKGDFESFRSLYFIHFSSLYEYGMRLIYDADVVKDCIHDLFIRLWERKLHLSGVSAIRSYLLVSLRSVIFNYKKKESRMKTRQIDDADFRMVFSEETELVTRETQSELADQLSGALDQLTPRQKEMIYLRYFEGMEYEQIAKMLDISLKAAYKLNARAIEVLRNIFNTSLTLLLVIFRFVK